MNKTLLAATLAVAAAVPFGANAERYQTLPGDVSLGIEGGMTTPLDGGFMKGNSPFSSLIRGAVGLHAQKDITPLFGIGVEALWGINTSSWPGQTHSSTAFDSQYVGAYGSWNVLNSFGVRQRIFDFEVLAGLGWGHFYQNEGVQDHNFMATKVGLSLNFHVAERVCLSIKPSVMWDMTDANVDQTSAAYQCNKAVFNLLGGVSFIIGRGAVQTCQYSQADIDELNGQINGLRGQLAGITAAVAEAEAQGAGLAQQLNDCLNRKPEVVKSTTDQLSTVRYVNFELGRYNITAAQMPNVAAVASYLKNHPKANVVIKGYASQDGPEDVNIRLANQRAASVKDTLIKKYGIKADRIQAEGQGIGHMFEEESWNRVAICTLDQPATTTTTVTK